MTFHSFLEKIGSGLGFAFTDVWRDLVGWFFFGLFLAGLITSLVPDDFFKQYLGGGITTMLIMLAMGIPLYICATASTPVAAALIMKGIDPGAALVFLLAGPATNITSLTVLIGVLGKKTAMIYLSTIAIFSIICGLAVSEVYQFIEVSPQAVVGHASEMVAPWIQFAGALFLLILSIKPLYLIIKRQANRMGFLFKNTGEPAASVENVKKPRPCPGST